MKKKTQKKQTKQIAYSMEIENLGVYWAKNI